MNKSFLSVFVYLVTFAGAWANDHFTLTFKWSDYNLDVVGNCISIDSNNKDSRMFGDSTMPCFPYTPLRIIIPEGMDSLSYEVSFETIQLYENVKVVANTQKEIAKGNSVHVPFQPATSSVNMPVANCGIVQTAGDKYLFLKVSPFTYDVSMSCLSFVTTVRIDFSELNEVKTVESLNINGINNQIDNHDDRSILTTVPDTIYDDNTYDYLIITNPALYDSFDNLCTWKLKKGLNPYVIDTEYISHRFSGSDLQEKIKTCIYYYYQNYGTKWVLLGGDDTIVPARICFVEDELGTPSYTPSDLYYACFDGTFNWNANGNGLYGETMTV